MILDYQIKIDFNDIILGTFNLWPKDLGILPSNVSMCSTVCFSVVNIASAGLSFDFTTGELVNPVTIKNTQSWNLDFTIS